MKLLVLLFSPLLLCATAFAEMVVVSESAMPVKGGVTSSLAASKTLAVQSPMDDQSQKQLLTVFNTPVMRAQVEQFTQNQKTALANAGVTDPKEQDRLLEKASAKMVEAVNKLAGMMGKEFKVVLDKAWAFSQKMADATMSFVANAVLYTLLVYVFIGFVPGVGPAIQRLMAGDGIIASLWPWKWVFRSGESFAKRAAFWI